LKPRSYDGAGGAVPSPATLLAADVVVLLLKHPGDDTEAAQEVGAIRAFGATTLAYLRRYVAYRLREVASLAGGTAASVRDAIVDEAGDELSLYVGTSATPFTTPTASLTDDALSLAQLYTQAWDDVDVPLVLLYKTAPTTPPPRASAHAGRRL